MPNGQDLSDDSFELLNGPMLQIDALLEEFARKIGGKLIYNYHNSPDRQIRLREESGIRKMISLSPVWLGNPAAGSSPKPHYVLDAAAYRDTDHSRTSWFDRIAELRAEQLSEEVASLLDRAWERLKLVDLPFLRAQGQTMMFPSGRTTYSAGEMNLDDC